MVVVVYFIRLFSSLLKKYSSSVLSLETTTSHTSEKPQQQQQWRHNVFFIFSAEWAKDMDIVVPIGKRISDGPLERWWYGGTPSPEFLLLKWNEKKERKKIEKIFVCVISKQEVVFRPTADCIQKGRNS